MSFWRPIYTALWMLGLLVIPILALRNEKIRRWWRARKVAPPLPPKERPVLWMHCASVGEFEQGRPVLEYIIQRLPYRPYVVISFFSSSGWQRYQQSYPIGDWVGPAPIDLPWVVRKWVKTLQPAAVFFVKYDLWPNLLHELHAAKCPSYLLSAHVEPVKGLRWWWKIRFFPYLKWIFVQTEKDAQRLRQVGFSKVTVAGDSRLVRVRQLAENWLPISGLYEWINGHFCIVAGSVWEDDVRFLAQAYEQLRGYSVHWILVPHDVSPKQVELIHRIWPVRCAQYSHPEWNGNKDTLILDTTGLLAYVYFYAHAVWVGGGFGKGIHNILEAIIYKKPVFFGPNYEYFSEAHELIALRVAESCRYPVSFSNAIKSLIKDRRRLQIIAEKVDKYIQHKPNTPEIVWQHLKEEGWVSPVTDQAAQEDVG
ncbi:MAG: hypothetical protein N3E49_05350 [Bacteroidia bacterium]|nr:hypothetical protein [Bacteroidia bacterium]